MPVTNLIERLNGEIKRRSDGMGIFPNAWAAKRTKAIARLIGALLLGQSNKWAVQRARYMTLGTIASGSDDLTVSLPPQAA